MNLKEIVGAVVDSVMITTNPMQIDTSKALGQRVKYITRNEAREYALDDRTGIWGDLASARTLFLISNGVVFRPTHSGGRSSEATVVS